MSTTIYTKPGCPQCMATRRAFDRLGLDYRTVDITHDPTAAQTLRDAGFLQAPVVVADAGSWSGYRPDRIRLLAQRDAAA